MLKLLWAAAFLPISVSTKRWNEFIRSSHRCSLSVAELLSERRSAMEHPLAELPRWLNAVESILNGFLVMDSSVSYTNVNAYSVILYRKLRKPGFNAEQNTAWNPIPWGKLQIPTETLGYKTKKKWNWRQTNVLHFMQLCTEWCMWVQVPPYAKDFL